MMKFQGLKTQITLAVVFLLTMGMVLISLVTITLWQRQMIDSEISWFRMTLDLIGSRIAAAEKNNDKAVLDKKKILLPEDSRIMCLQSIGQVEVQDGKSSCKDQPQLGQLLEKVVASGEEQYQFTGSVWGVISFGSRRLIIGVPIQSNGRSYGAVGLVGSLEPVYKNIRRDVQIILAYLLVNVVILSAIGLFRLIKVIVRPVENLVGLADTFDDKEPVFFIGENGANEFSKLSQSLNRMLERINSDNKRLRSSVESLVDANEQLKRNRAEMVRVEKLASVGRLSAGLAHEIGNPLGVISGYLEILESTDLLKEERKQYCRRAGQELDRISNLIRQLLDFSRISSKVVECLSVSQVLGDTIDLIRIRAEKSSIQIIEEYQAVSDMVEINKDGLRQVIVNCLLNAVDGIMEKKDGGNGEITVCTANRYDELKKMTYLVISIADNGAGIETENINKIFDPFFTTKEVGRGTGLGLFVSHTIIENSGGRIWIESQVGKGTEMSIELPTIEH